MQIALNDMVDCRECEYVHKECDWWCFHKDAPTKADEGIPLDEQIDGGFIVRVVPPSWCPVLQRRTDGASDER